MQRLGHAFKALLAITLASLAVPAHAEWTEVSSDHFVIYGDQKPQTLREFSERLELFHAAMSATFHRKVVKPSPSNRLTVYVVPDERDVRKLSGLEQRNVAGVYRPRAGQSFAIVPRLRSAKFDDGNWSEIILYHEYAHHFMYGLSARAYPRWYVEGFAEFFSTAQVSDDKVGLGLPANHRAYELLNMRRVPIREMLTYDGGPHSRGDQESTFYGQSWALFHLLVFERREQLAAYQQMLAEGQAPLQAAEGAFGDLDKLGKDLASYVRRPQLKYMPIPRTDLVVGPIVVRALGAAEAAVMPARLRSRTGVTPEEAAEVVLEARRIAEKFPDDPAVLTELAEAEMDSQHYDAAIGAADRALALDPRQMNAWVQKGYALMEKAATSQSVETWASIRSHWVKANKIENDNPIPLAFYYATFLRQGIAPTTNSIRGLEWAMELAPFDPELRWMAAQQMVNDDRLAHAVATLRPLAYSPHPGSGTDAARKLLDELELRIASGKGTEPKANSAP